MSLKFILMIAIGLFMRVQSSGYDVKAISTGFMRPLNDCKKEALVTLQMEKELNKFWNVKYDTNDEDMGCAFLCLAIKAEMIDRDSSFLYYGSIKFFKNNGNEEKAQELTKILQSCYNRVLNSPTISCKDSLNIMKCFKAGIIRPR